MQTIEITQDMVVKLMLQYDTAKKAMNEENGEVYFEYVGFLQGTRFVLDTLGIYIDGINYNAEEVQTNVEDNEASRG